MAKTTDTTIDKTDTPAVPDTAPASAAPKKAPLKVEIVKHETNIDGLIFAVGAIAWCDADKVASLVDAGMVRILGV